MAREVKAVYAGEMRCPKAGEWYLSGAIVGAYKARNDLSTPYHIAKLVKAGTRTVTTLSPEVSRRESSFLCYSVGE